MRVSPRGLARTAAHLRPLYLPRRSVSSHAARPPPRTHNAPPPRSVKSPPPAAAQETPSSTQAAVAAATASPLPPKTSDAEAPSPSAAQPPPDPQRGIEASQRFAQKFVVDTRYKESPRYRAASARIRAVYVALPVLIVTSYFLWQRLHNGVQQKRVPVLEAED